MANMPPWSHSTLTSYETCPRRYYLTKVTRTVTEPQTEATIWGNSVHQALEKRAKTGEALPIAIKAYEPIVDKILNRDGRRLVEEKMAIDESFQPAQWSKSWCRGIVDLGIVDTKTAYMFDWKTGKRKPDSEQMKLMALLTLHTYPYIEKVKTSFIWLKDGKIDQDVFTREQIPTLWQDFIPRVNRLANAYEKERWEPKPSGLCGSWCPCTGCEFNGRRSGKS
jgi:CRISPR/Cas system-associated exonuclease Cas4 (RecB family)